jgi:hypothetical protein
VAAIGLVIVAASSAVAATDLRYSVIGSIWKSEVSLRVVDSDSGLPVSHATVTLAGLAEFTDKTGTAQFHKVRPGKTSLKVTRVAYATANQPQTVGFGEVTLGTVKLKPTGVQVVSQVNNAITGEGVPGVEVKAGDVRATTDTNGKALLVFPPSANNTTETIEYLSSFYNSLKVETQVVLGGKPIVAAVVPKGKAYYLSNRGGRIDLYSTNLDGSDPTVVLAGTGNEDSDTGILPNLVSPEYLAPGRQA